MGVEKVCRVGGWSLALALASCSPPGSRLVSVSSGSQPGSGRRSPSGLSSVAGLSWTASCPPASYLRPCSLQRSLSDPFLRHPCLLPRPRPRPRLPSASPSSEARSPVAGSPTLNALLPRTAKDKSNTGTEKWEYGYGGLGQKDKNQGEVTEKHSPGSTPPPVYNSLHSETRSRTTRSGRSHSSPSSSQLEYDQAGATPRRTPRSVSTSGGSIHYIPPHSSPKASGRSGRPTLCPYESSSTLAGSALECKVPDEIRSLTCRTPRAGSIASETSCAPMVWTTGTSLARFPFFVMAKLLSSVIPSEDRMAPSTLLPTTSDKN